VKLRYGNWDDILESKPNDDGCWGYDLFVDDYGNQYVLTAWYGIQYGYRVTNKEANALTKPLGVE
jgi:hypothetical protein